MKVIDCSLKNSFFLLLGSIQPLFLIEIVEIRVKIAFLSITWPRSHIKIVTKKTIL